MIVKNNSKELETDYAYIVNGKSVDKETFDDYVSKFTSNSVDEDTDEDKSTDSGYSITVKVGLDTDEAEKMIRDMRKIFREKCLVCLICYIDHIFMSIIHSHLGFIGKYSI